MCVVEVKRSGSGGAFHPFHKEERGGKTSESLSKAPSSSAPVAATSSTAVAAARSDNAGGSKREEKEGQRKQRRCWSQELHKRFLHALQQLGGADCEYLNLKYITSFWLLCVLDAIGSCNCILIFIFWLL